jgi:hypothetical protein
MATGHILQPGYDFGDESEIGLSVILDALGMVRGELSRAQALLGDLDPAEWQRPTDCTGWSVRDVVAHMIGENEELSRPARLIRRIRMARRLAANDGDGGTAAELLATRVVSCPGGPVLRPVR